MTSLQEQKPYLWGKDYIIENLPAWIYSDNTEPKSVAECKAKVSAIEYTIRDIELQIEIRELELETGNSRHATNFEFQKWRAQALRAKQTHLYLLNAYKYWLLLNEREHNNTDVGHKLNKLIKLLALDPPDLFEKLDELL